MTQSWDKIRCGQFNAGLAAILMTVMPLFATLAMASGNDDKEKKNLCLRVLQGGKGLPVGGAPRLFEPSSRDFLLALASRKRLAAEKAISTLPQDLLKKVQQFGQLSFQEQVDVFQALGSKERASLVMSLIASRAKLQSKKYQITDQKFIDPTLFQVARGHIVEMIVMVPHNGILSDESHFFDQQAAPALYEDTMTIPFVGGDGFFHRLSNRMDDPNLRYSLELNERLRGQGPTRYAVEYMRGVIKKPHGESTDGVMTLEDGTDVDSRNVLVINIVGVHAATLLQRDENELYISRPVRVWCEERGKWLIGKIVEPDGPQGLIAVQTVDGHTLIVEASSADLDLRDPKLYPPKRHIMEDFPHITTNRLVRIKSENGQFSYGRIAQINANKHTYIIYEDEGQTTVAFDNPDIEFLENSLDVPGQPQIKIDNRIFLMDFRARKNKVYKILGYDHGRNIIIAEIISQRPLRSGSVFVFRADDTRLVIYPNNNGKIFKKFPLLSKIPEYSEFPYQIEFRDSKGLIRRGEIRSIKTLPVYIEVTIRKNPIETRNQGGVYHNFDVYPDQILRILKPVEGK